MSDVKVSVCMVTYNQENYIAQAVESVLAQETNFPYEIVLGEDCSTDSTRAIVEELAARRPDVIRLRLAEQNQGAKRNFMGCFAACRGQYVVILEGDDYFTHPDKLQQQADLLDAHAEWAMVFHPARCLFEDGLKGPEIYPVNWAKPVATIYDLLAANFIATAGAMFRNRLIPQLPEWFVHSDLGDWPLHILNASHGDIGYMPEPMSVYRIHAKGVWSGRDLATNLTSVFRMLTAVDHHFAGKYTAPIEENRVNTLRWLIQQTNDRNLVNPNDADELQRTCNQLILDNRELHSLRQQRDRLLAEVESLRPLTDKCHRLSWQSQLLAEENGQLREFHRAWSKTLHYRAVRETRRFASQIHSLGQKLLKRPPTPGDQPPDVSSRAA